MRVVLAGRQNWNSTLADIGDTLSSARRRVFSTLNWSRARRSSSFVIVLVSIKASRVSIERGNDETCLIH